MIDSVSKGNTRKENPALEIAYREMMMEVDTARSQMFAEASAAASKLELARQDLDQRENTFGRRIKIIFLCHCAIASCVGIAFGVATFLLMGVIY